MTFWAEN